MDKNEARMWAVTVAMAKKGDKESQETLQAQNQLRQEQGLPSVEDELRAMINQ